MLGSDKTDLEYEVKVPTVCCIFVGRVESEIILNTLAMRMRGHTQAGKWRLHRPSRDYLQMTRRGSYITSLCKNRKLI
jgi:hypothetical protein